MGNSHQAQGGKYGASPTLSRNCDFSNLLKKSGCPPLAPVHLAPLARLRGTDMGSLNFRKNQNFLAFTALGTVLLFLSLIKPASAHHFMGGKVPSNFLTGFLSGLAHPVIGLDHFAFVVAVGLLAALLGRQGLVIPVAFILATVGGTGIHLLRFDLPLPEVAIAAFLVLFGIWLAMTSRPNPWLLVGTAAAAGIFHGYAYGESIIGSQMTPLLAYLAGFALIQLAIAAGSYQIGCFMVKGVSDHRPQGLRVAGLILAGVGTAFLGTALFG